MDPVTGLSRRSLRALVAVVAIGVAAATVATVGRAAPGCPDERYGCATFQAGEPVVLGVLLTRDQPVEEIEAGVRAAVEERGGLFLGRRLRPFVWTAACGAAPGAEGARELATDPLDEPPVVAVISAACPEASLPATQILADSGIPVVTLTPPPAVPRGAPSLLDGTAVARRDGPAGVASRLLTAGEALAVTHDGQVLVPRTPLVRTLAAGGFARPAP